MASTQSNQRSFLLNEALMILFIDFTWCFLKEKTLLRKSVVVIMLLHNITWMLSPSVEKLHLYHTYNNLYSLPSYNIAALFWKKCMEGMSQITFLLSSCFAVITRSYNQLQCWGLRKQNFQFHRNILLLTHTYSFIHSAIIAELWG